MTLFGIPTFGFDDNTMSTRGFQPEVTTPGTHITRALAETVSFGGTPAYVMQRQASLAESYSISDALTRAVHTHITRALVDTYSIGDTVAKSLQRAGRITQTLTIGDTLSRIYSITKSLTEAEAITDKLDRYDVHRRGISETVSFRAVLTRGLYEIGMSLTDSWSTSDVITWARNHYRSLADSYGISDTISHTRHLVRNISEFVMMKYYLLHATLMDQRRLIETVKFKAKVKHKMQLRRAVSEIIPIHEDLNRMVTYVFAETVRIGDALTAKSYIIRSLVESSGIADALTRITGLHKELYGYGFNVFDRLDRSTGLVRSVTASWSITEHIGRTLGEYRSITESVTIGTTITHGIEQARRMYESIRIGDRLVGTVMIVRALAERTGIHATDTDRITRHFHKAFAESYNITDALGRIVHAGRTLSEHVQMRSVLEYNRDVLRRIADRVPFTDHMIGWVNHTAEVMERRMNITDAVAYHRTVLRRINERIRIIDMIRYKLRYGHILKKTTHEFDISDKTNTRNVK